MQITILVLFFTMSAFTKQVTSAGTKLRGGLVWFKGNDLRVRDHQPLTAAHERCAQVQHVFVFDPRHYRTTRRGQLKANLRRLKFQVECVNDLAKTLSERGSGLTVLVGEPETVLPAYAKELNLTSDACRLFCFDEVCHEEVKVLNAAKAALDQQCGVPVQTSCGGSTLFDPTGNVWGAIGAYQVVCYHIPHPLPCFLPAHHRFSPARFAVSNQQLGVLHGVSQGHGAPTSVGEAQKTVAAATGVGSRLQPGGRGPRCRGGRGPAGDAHRRRRGVVGGAAGGGRRALPGTHPLRRGRARRAELPRG